MRDLAMALFMIPFVWMGLRHAFAGYLLWGWSGLISVGAYLYGFMMALPYAQIFALATMFSLLVTRDALRRPFEVNPTSVWMVLFVLHAFFAALLAYPSLERNWELFGNLAKTALFCLLMPMLVSTRLRIHAMVIMLAMAISFHGVLDGLKFIASVGAHNARGIAKFGDNNQFALVLLLAIPLLIYLIQYSRRALVRWAFALVALLNVLAIVATHSRGAFAGLLVIAFFYVIRGRHRVLALLAIAVVTVAVSTLAPERWSDRMATIQQADEDASFLGRVYSWRVSSAIALEHPVWGGGFRAVQSDAVWQKFLVAPSLLPWVEVPPGTREGIAAHSIWFEVLGDLGFVGLLLFLALLVNAFRTRREILKMARKHPVRLAWASDLANLLGILLLVYMISGSLLSAAYFETPYIVMMLLEVLRMNLKREVGKST